MNLNKVFIIGNLTRDPELRSLPSGISVVSFGVATNRVWKDKNGAKQEDVQFHNIVAFGKQAEIVKQYLGKGSSVLIEGRIQTRNWEAQDGQKRSKTEIVSERLQLGPRRGEPQGQKPSPKSDAKTEPLETIEYPEEEVNPDEIPF
ncbi:MAG: single-stranded DNA-binding protein [bacterium]|nr:single-stranded DNA-binding protein [bacterium]